MTRGEVCNFAAGPSVMPESALVRAREELLNYGGSGMSVMEMSHRSKTFGAIFDSAQEKLRRVLNVPESHDILFLQGGATLQFAAIPMNLMGLNGTADYAVTGNFSGIAAREAEKYGTVCLAASSADRDHSYIPAQDALRFTPARAISITAPTTPSTARSGSMCPIRAEPRWCAICPPTSSPGPWTSPNTRWCTPAPRKTWLRPVSPW